MRKIGVWFVTIASAAMILSSCTALKGAAIGGAGVGAVGAGVGAIAGGGKGAAIGAAVGVAVGSTAGALIGRKMDKQKEELAKIEGARVESVTDTNGLEAIKVTFDSSILFDTGSSELSTASKNALTQFAATLQNTPETDVTIYGHTDNTGSLAVNEKVSQARAESVQKYLIDKGVAGKRIIKVEGRAYNEPVADNSTAEGRAANRRVEIFISANSTMVEQAEAGTLK